MAGGQVLLNCNVVFTGIRDVSWRVLEWAGGDATPSALEQYSAAVRSGQLVACTATRPMVLWHFTPRAASHDDVFRSPPWHEIDRGSQPVGRLSATAARLLDTAVVNVIEARLLSLRSYVLLPPCSLAPAASLPLLRSGPSSVGAALHGTLGVEVVTFVQGEQLGIVAQVRRHSIVSVRPAELRKELSAMHSPVLVGRKAEEAVLLGVAPLLAVPQNRWQQTFEEWFPHAEARLRVRLRSSALELQLPAECVWRSCERNGLKEIGEKLRKQTRDVLEEAGENKARSVPIKHSASTPTLMPGGPDDSLPLLARSMPDTQQTADAKRRASAMQRDSLKGASVDTLNAGNNAGSNKRQRGETEDLYGSSELVLEQWLASVPEVQPPPPVGTSPPPAAGAAGRVLSSSAPQLQRSSARHYHCPSIYAPINLPALPQAAYAPRDSKLHSPNAEKYAPLVDLTCLPPPPTLPVAHASNQEQPAKEGKADGEEASPEDASDSPSSSSEHGEVGPSPADMVIDAAAPSAVLSEEADREAAQEEWLLGALVNEGSSWRPQAKEERPPTRSPTDAHVALTVASAMNIPLPLPLSPSSAASHTFSSISLSSTATLSSTLPPSLAAVPPPASFTVSLLVEHFFSSASAAIPALQLQPSPPLMLRHTPKVDDAEAVPLEIPQLIAGYEDDWISVPPSVIPLWDKAVLEPYSPAKDIIFYAVLLGTPTLDFSARAFFRELSATYEACRLGLHRPHDSDPFISVERAQTDGQQLSAYSTAFQALTKHLLKSSLSYADSSFVVYIVHPFARSPAAMAELNQLASEIVRECSGRNSLVNVAIQMLSTEEIQLRDALPLALKELAFASFSKTRRVAFPHLAAKIYEPLFVLAPLSKEPKENTLHVGLARSEDGLWELCAVTDERGELLEVKPFLRASFSPDALRREIWAFATQFLLGARDVRWRVAVTCLTDALDEEERALWHETILAAPRSEDVAVPLARVAILSCSAEHYMQFLPAGLAPEEPPQTASAPLHFAVFPRNVRRMCRAGEHAAPLLQSYVVSPAPVPAPNVPLPGEPSSVLSVVFYDFCSPAEGGVPLATSTTPTQTAPSSPSVAPAAAVATVVTPPDVQLARSITRQLHRLSFLTTSPAWPNRASSLPFHLAVLQRLASLIRQTTNFAAFTSDG